MTQELLMDKYPIFTTDITKEDSRFDSVDAIVAFLQEQIVANPVAAFIGVFNHYEHTSSLENGSIAEGICDAKNIIFCFGQKIPNPKILAVRPRSIGVVETANGFTLSFLEAPMAPLTEKMVAWVEAIKK